MSWPASPMADQRPGRPPYLRSRLSAPAANRPAGPDPEARRGLADLGPPGHVRAVPLEDAPLPRPDGEHAATCERRSGAGSTRRARRTPLGQRNEQREDHEHDSTSRRAAAGGHVGVSPRTPRRLPRPSWGGRRLMIPRASPVLATAGSWMWGSWSERAFRASRQGPPRAAVRRSPAVPGGSVRPVRGPRTSRVSSSNGMIF